MTYNVTIDLGKIKFKWQGSYLASTAYKKDDVVYYLSSAWVALADVTGVTPSASASEWDLMVEGSDVNSLLTTSGDLLVRGSSGLERLAKGSVGDVLKVGAAGLEYGQSTQAGQILEQLSARCDGRQVTVQSGTYTMPNITAGQNLTTSYLDVTGSSISYTPPAGTTRVRYDFDMKLTAVGYSGISHYKFYIDNVEVTSARTTRNFSYSASNQGNLKQRFSWVIDCNAASASAADGSFTSWTTAKTMNWKAREYNSDYQMALHQNNWWDGTGASGTNVIDKPEITITAIA